jgi:succinate dehydrogenase hydrophobic anchor subunit
MTSLWSLKALSAIVLVLYVGAYVWFRQTSTEIWQRG